MAYEFVDPPRGLSYGAPLVDFGVFGQLPQQYQQGVRTARENAVADAFKDGGLPLDPATGQPDYGKIMQVLASKGGIDAITKLAPSATEQSLINQAGRVSPLLGGAAPPGPAAGPAAAPQGPASAPAAPQSLPAPPATSTAGYTPMRDTAGSVVDIVTSRLPQDSQRTGAVIANIAKAAGVDPNGPLSPEQSARVTRMADAYVARTGQQPAPAAPPAAAGPAAPRFVRTGLGLGFPVDPQDNGNLAVASRFPADMAPAVGSGAASPPAAAASGPAAPPPATAPNAAPVQGSAAAQQPPQGGPIVPPVPLPPGYTDPQKAILALRQEAAKRSSNPYDKQGPMLSQWADRIETSLQPIKLGQSDTWVSPQTGQIVAQGPMAKALAGGAGGINAATLDADAERYRQTGQLPPNMGRGVQGQAEAAAIRARAVEHETAAGGNPNEWPTRWQEYRARGVGMNTAERVRAGREESLNLILKVTDSAIPAALEQSEKVYRTSFVPLNKIIQQGQVMTSDAELRAFGMANLQLAEGWARAMNPTGVMRQDDREKALSFLSTADSPATYRRLVNQLKTQITRERDSIRKGEPRREGDRAPEPGVVESSKGGVSDSWVPIKTKTGVSVEVQEIQ